MNEPDSPAADAARKDAQVLAADLASQQRRLRVDAERAAAMGQEHHLRSLQLFEEARHLGGRICRALQEHHVMEIRTKWGVSLRCQRCGRRVGVDGRALP